MENESEERNTLRLRDGFLIPPEADEDHVDASLNEYAENRFKIESMCNVDLSNSGFLGFGIDEDKANKCADEVISLMARNYSIVEKLQGHEMNPDPKQTEIRKKEIVREFVRLRLQTFISTSRMF